MLLIWGVLFEMSELRHLNFLFPVKEEQQQLCQGSGKVGESKCKLSYNCLVGHRNRGIGREPFKRKGYHCFVTAACFFFSWDERQQPQSLTSSQNCQRRTVETTWTAAKSGHGDGQDGKTSLHLCTLLLSPNLGCCS